MKSILTYSLLTILGAVQANAQCVDGHRETISPGYTVEYKCGMYRQGELHKNIASENACATLCKDANRSVCSYYPTTKRCIVGNIDGQDIPRDGVTYMVKVADAPVEKDPFDLDCEEEKDDCLDRENKLKDELTECQAQTSCPAPPSQPSEPVCPSSNSAIYTTINNKQYIIHCREAVYGQASAAPNAPGTSLTDCIEQCSQIQDCANVNFIPSKCEFRKSIEPSDLSTARRPAPGWHYAALIRCIEDGSDSSPSPSPAPTPAPVPSCPAGTTMTAGKCTSTIPPCSASDKLVSDGSGAYTCCPSIADANLYNHYGNKYCTRFTTDYRVCNLPHWTSYVPHGTEYWCLRQPDPPSCPTGTTATSTAGCEAAPSCPAGMTASADGSACVDT